MRKKKINDQLNVSKSVWTKDFHLQHTVYWLNNIES